MQILRLLFAVSIFIAVGTSALEDLDPILFSDASLDLTLFQNENLSDRPIESSLNFFLDDNDASSSLTELDPNLSDGDNGGWESGVLFGDQDDPNQILGTDSTFLLGSDFGCDISDADNTPLFSKVRRRESCPDPFVGQAETPDQPKDDPNAPNNDDAPRLNPYAAVLKEYLFRNPLICPMKVFGLSNVPVCKLDADVNDFEQVGMNVFNIRDVIPPSKGPMPCLPEETLYCCRNIIIRSYVPGDYPAELPPTLHIGDIPIFLALVANRIDAQFCYKQDLIYNGLPVFIAPL